MIDEYNYNDEPSGRVDTLTMALDKCVRLDRQLIKTKNILADLTFSAPCDSILHRQIKEKAEQFFKGSEK